MAIQPKSRIRGTATLLRYCGVVAKSWPRFWHYRRLVIVLGSLLERVTRRSSRLGGIRCCKTGVSRSTSHASEPPTVPGGLATDDFLFNTERFALAALLRNRFHRFPKIFAGRGTDSASGDLDRACARRDLSREDNEYRSSPCRRNSFDLEDSKCYRKRAIAFAFGVSRCIYRMCGRPNRALVCLERSHFRRSDCYWLKTRFPWLDSQTS